MNQQIEQYPKVAVLMSTYNGEKYIHAQLDSILAQKGVDVSIFIRDDHSSDLTVKIIDEYIIRFPKKLHIYTGSNMGAGRSFMNLVYTVPDMFEYYAYSDQDDIWFDDKLKVAITTLKKSNMDLYMGNLICVDKNLNEIGLRNIISPDISPYGIMVNNETNGCTMVFTNTFYRMLSDKSKRPNDDLFNARYHDSWTAMVGAVNGKVIYDHESHILYRQHEGNTVGATNYNGFCRRFKVKLNKFTDISKRNGRSKIAIEIIKAYPNETEKFDYLYEYAYSHKFSNKLKLIKNYKEYKKHGKQNFVEYVLYVILGLI